MSAAFGESALRLPGERVLRTLPENLDPADEALFAHEFVKDFASVEARSLSDLRVLPNGFLVRNFWPLAESFVNAPSGLRRAKVAVRALQYGLSARPGPGLGRALFATDEFSNGFFHWIGDVLPRLEALAASAPGELAELTLVVPAMADFPYVAPSLAPYGLSPPRILGPDESVRCAELVVMPAVAPTGNYRPALMRALRERFRNFFGAVRPVGSAGSSGADGSGRPAGSGRRLFISRAEAPWRRIADEEELLPILERHGFERVVMESLPFEEEVRLVAQAEVVVGNHGAGLTHLAWMAPGAKVLELRRRGDAANNCYFSLASALDIAYYYLQCDPVYPAADTHVADLVVDVAAFERTLALVCSGA
ncbi:MAG TPA: glycosyltransferase family 61 protein [Rectinemataceae bacterium]|nr:glycosyltransferase family 61 protein [Rectinemataceae bacterium]